MNKFVISIVNGNTFLFFMCVCKISVYIVTNKIYILYFNEVL